MAAVLTATASSSHRLLTFSHVSLQNIYPSGKVCLSIINDEQGWKPSITIKQVGTYLSECCNVPLQRVCALRVTSETSHRNQRLRIVQFFCQCRSLSAFKI